MKKSVNREVRSDRYFHKFLALVFDIIAYLALFMSGVFIFMGFGNEGWEIFSSTTFWTVINSFWLFAIIFFYFADRLVK